MSLSTNIAKFRKINGYTQDKLGELLGVTNQSVSKWELGISMPDIMMLPQIAEALNITLNDLYGIEDKTKSTEKVTADKFPKAANDNLIEYFVNQSGMHYNFTQSEKENLEYNINKIYENACVVLGCISDEAGAVFVSRDISYINTDYKTEGSEYVFAKREITSVLKKLSDTVVCKLLAYMYKVSFSEKDTDNKGFLIDTVAKDCGLSEDEVLEAFEKLVTINLLEASVNNKHITEYYFLKSRAVFVFSAFKLLEKMSMDFAFNVMRDTSTISDYAFEQLW